MRNLSEEDWGQSVGDYSPYRVGVITPLTGRGRAEEVEKSRQGARTCCGNPATIGEESGCGNQRKGELQEEKHQIIYTERLKEDRSRKKNIS